LVPDGKFIDIRLAVENANEFPFWVVNAEANRAVEWRGQKTDANTSLRGWTRRGRWTRQFLRDDAAKRQRGQQSQNSLFRHSERSRGTPCLFRLVSRS